MARNDRKQERPPLGQEIASVLGIFTALFLLLSLLSYSLPQPGLITPPNWGGAFGGFVEVETFSNRWWSAPMDEVITTCIARMNTAV